MSLAEELLADFGDEEEEEEEEERDEIVRDDEGDTQTLNDSLQQVRQVAKYSFSLPDQLQRILEQVRHFNANPTLQPTTTATNLDHDPEYKLLNEANNAAADIDEEVIVVNRFIKEHYAPRFPELESLVINPLDYAKTVKAIGNEMDVTKVRLNEILPSGTVMVVTVTATTTNGGPLPGHELKLVMDACKMALELDSAKRVILEFIQSRMTKFAPNLTEVIGPMAAANLLGKTGGLAGLSSTPACNVPNLGAKRQAQTGLSLNAVDRQHGFLFDSEVLQSTPPDLRRQALRIVSAKVILAARIDYGRGQLDGAQGRKFRLTIEEHLDRLAEPPEHRGPKALPAPKEHLSKKRGGRKARAAKRAYAPTELSKLQNRMAFGKEEQEVGVYDETEGLGMLGQGDTGKLRAAGVSADRRAKLSKAGQVRLAAANAKRLHTSADSATSGLATSLAFTPFQGIELVDPTAAAQRKRKLDEANNSGDWFKTGTFTQVSKTKSDH